MANIAALLKRIESGTLSYEEKLSALSQVEQSLQDMRQKKQEAIQSNVMLIVDALKQMQVKVEQQLEEAKAIVPQKGQKGDKGEKGERGLDGAPGKDGRNGIDGKDGKDGNDGISVTDAKIDFDGSLVITLSNGREINVGEVLPLEVSDKIKVIANGGGTSQTVVDTLTSLQNQINTLTGIDGVLGDMAQQNANNVAITGGAINGATIGGVTPAAGTFTTLTATGTSYFGGSSTSRNVQVDPVAAATSQYTQFSRNVAINEQQIIAASTANLGLVSTGGGVINFWTATSGEKQFVVGRTASAVNYVQVTGAATGSFAQISAQGSDAITGLGITSKGAARINFFNNNGTNRQVSIGGNGAAAVNYLDLNGSATGIATSIGPAGSDANIALAFQSKGTGAIDLAAGSSGVNISNGGTVTAITRTAAGSAYTSVPSVVISAPTTAGGVQATATATAANLASGNTIASGGTGYTVNDVLTVVGGTGGPTTLTVTSVSGGVITGFSQTSNPAYTVTPTNPVSVTGGTGSGATFNLVYGIGTAFTITNAGSGYVEQPTVSFSGGGGSGAAAYATVGSGAVIRSIGSAGIGSIDFNTPASATNGVPALRIRDVLSSTPSNTGYFLLHNNNGYAQLTAQGPTDAQMAIGASGTGYIRFNTNGTGETNQMRVTHTANAVNYVQVTGSATGASSVISTQGSDTNTGLRVSTKGTANISFWSGSQAYTQFVISGANNAVNYLQVAGTTATNAPVLSAQGTDTNIGLNLTTKGTGSISFNTGNGEQFRVYDNGVASIVNYWSIRGANTGATPLLYAQGADTNVNGVFTSAGTGYLAFRTNGNSQEQLRVAHTASAVNYVQVTGAATSSDPTISAQGSDASINFTYLTKGSTGEHRFSTNTGGNIQFKVTHTGSAANYLTASGNIAGSSPKLSAQGSDTNIDLTLTPKGTGYVQFGTYTGTALTIAGYIEIKDSGGTVRKLAVVA